MKFAIEVNDKNEGQAIKDALEDPVLKAAVLIVGILRKLPSDKIRRRVLRNVAESLDDQQVSETPTSDDHESA